MPIVAKLLETTPNALPAIRDFNDEADEQSGEVCLRTEAIMLFLPSALSSTHTSDHVISSLQVKEKELRTAQASDALVDIRRLRRVLTGIWQFKLLNTSGTGQKQNTKTRTLYTGFQTKLRYAVARYRAAYNALCVLDANGTWTSRFQVLRDEDVRGPGRENDEGMIGDGYREMSWIWRVLDFTDASEADSEYNNSLRVEWAQSRARALRWIEETILIPEEMRRVLSFSEWRAIWWLEQAERRTNVSIALRSGLSAYAHKQAAIYRQRAQKFALQWLPIFHKQGITPEWENNYKIVSATEDTVEIV